MQRLDSLWKYYHILYRGANEVMTEAETRYVEKLIKAMPRDAFRHPQTHNEMAQTETMVLDEDVRYYDVRIRPSRRPKNLPDSYDDVPHGTHYFVEHRKPWRSRKQRRLIARFESGAFLVAE